MLGARTRHPFPRILCAAGDEHAETAIAQARAVAGDDGRLTLAADEDLLAARHDHDLVVVGAHEHSRIGGIVLGETATELVHRSRHPVLVAREKPLAAGVIAATRALPSDRAALTAAAHLAARLGAELTIAHVADRDDPARRAELRAELANVRALLGRGIDYLELEGPPAPAIAALAAEEDAGLVVVGSDRRHGLDALRSVSERVAHTAPCSVLVMRG